MTADDKSKVYAYDSLLNNFASVIELQGLLSNGIIAVKNDFRGQHGK